MTSRKKKSKARQSSRGQQKEINRLRLKIEDLNEQGEGVAFYEKLKITVGKTLPGEEVLVEYNPRRPRKDRIHLLKILTPSPQRVPPPCPYYEECGGCHLQHMDYAYQLQFKQRIIKRLLLAYPHLRHTPVQAVVGMPEPFYYRNKCQMPFGRRGDEVVFGLYRKGTHDLVEMNACMVENRDANRILQTVREWANRYRIAIYDEMTHRGLLRHVVVRRGMFTHQVMVVLVVTNEEVPHWKELQQMLLSDLNTIKSIQLNINAQKTNRILGDRNILIWGDPFIEESLGRFRFRIFPETFFQINSVQMLRLLEQLVRKAKLKKSDVLLDLYSGVGTVGIYLSDKVQKVIGIEANEQACWAATQNARENGVLNAEFSCGDVSARLAELVDAQAKVDVVVLDPPRKGVEEKVVHQLRQMNPRQIFYISCNPTTLVRDLDRFFQAGYQTTEIIPFDMFPQTHHVESLAILQRKEEAQKSE